MITPVEALVASIWPAINQTAIQSLDEKDIFEITLYAEEFLHGWMVVPAYRRIIEGEMMRLTLWDFKQTRDCLILVEPGSLRDLDTARQGFSFTVSSLKP
jgi:hypothetical protein